MPSRKSPISAFGPELMAALLRGGRERLEIPFPTYREGHSFQARIYSLRQRMKESNHPMSDLAQRARVMLLFGEKAGFPPIEIRKTRRHVIQPADKNVPCLVVIQPQDMQFRGALEAAGITAGELSDEVLTDLPNHAAPQPSAAPRDWLDDFLKEPITKSEK